ncbi:MAG: 2-oxo-4-hydroxy-4-carboxy-5-ureidoimidazoline decarboxylase [Caryophanon sp.]|nr:2-oxo-4-hydroxy-4-carboxy-5-ureidoimidazoline decarboxylase [Caryophanon sp.]
MWQQQQFEHVFEHSAYIVERAFAQQEPTTPEGLFQSFVGVMATLSEQEQLQLLRAHPSLGANINMTTSSVNEQTSAGLRALTAEQYALFSKMNVAYEERFGFPFIIAVKGKSADEIYTVMESRITNSYDEELREALEQVLLIAKYRFEDVVGVSV